MKRIIFLIIVFSISYLQSGAQRRLPQDLAEQLRGKRTVAEVMDVVDRYYDFGRKVTKEPDEDEFESNDYHWWKKWAYWAKKRVNPDGTLPDYQKLNYQALQDVQSKFGQQLQQAKEYFKNQPPLDDRVSAANRSASREANVNRSYGGWSSIGPTSGGTVVGSGTNIDINGVGRMDRIAFHPTNGNIFYVCSPSGGVYKTTNGGTTWTDIGMGLPGGAACIEVARSNGNVIYVFTGDGDSHYSGTLVFGYDLSPISGGVFKSTDAGATWTKVTDMYTGPNDLVGHNMAISENNSNYLFAATDQGLYRTTDGGTTWTQVRTGNHYDVEFRPYNDSVVYASTASNVYYSIDGGRSGTWVTSTFDFSPAANRIDLAVRKNNLSAQSTFVYALSGQVTAAGQHRGLFLSTDGGATYTRQSNTPNIFGTQTGGGGSTDQTRYDLGICVRPDNVNTIATAGCCVWRSTNGGSTMTYSTTYRESLGPLAAYIHPDVHDVEYNPVNNNLYACTDGGVYRSTDDGVTWTDLSDGLAGSQFYHMGMQDEDGDGDMDGIMIVAGAQDNGIKYRTSGGSWRHIVCCDGYGAVINGNDDDWIVMNINNPYYQSPDGGVTMNFKGNIAFFSPMAVDYDNGDTMYIASSSLLRSYDGFLTTNATLGFDLNNFITTCPSNNARLYGSSSSTTNLRISEDRGASWTTISGNSGWPAGSPVVTDCKPWSTNSSEIYTTFGGYTAGVKVYRSFDAGATWTNYSGSLPNVPVHSCAVATEGVYVGTEIGVFFRPDGAADWTPFYTGMPNTIVTDIWVNENGFVYASTFGRGVWIADRFSACDALVTVSGALSGPHYYEASATANVTATSEGGAGTDIFVKSNGYVDLLPGFEMKDGTFFKAYLGPCSTGGIPTTARSSNGAGPNRSILEYDDKDQARRKLQATTYYTLVGDGIEVNLLQNSTLDIELANTKTGEVKKLVTQQKLTKGMYKILTGEGTFAVKVRVNGAAITKL
ncbi:MAG: hypothetical protein HOP10_02720 [Chitinophagaceae bacterium]|nr:hypothetical protein [Chitinophagaceae bacterium]